MSVKEQVAHWSSDWGVRLAAFAATGAGVVTANQDILVALISILPNGPIRLLIAIAAGVAVFGVPTITQILQDKFKEKSNVHSDTQTESQ